MTVFSCSPAVLKANNVLKNDCCVIFPSYSIYEILKSALEIGQYLDGRLKTEKINDGCFVLYKNDNKVMDSSNAPLSHKPADPYEHIEEFQEFLSNVADYLDSNIPAAPPEEYPDDYRYAVYFVSADETKNILVISVENTKETKSLLAKCLDGHDSVSLKNAALKSFAQGYFPKV